MRHLDSKEKFEALNAIEEDSAPDLIPQPFANESDSDGWICLEEKLDMENRLTEFKKCHFFWVR